MSLAISFSDKLVSCPTDEESSSSGPQPGMKSPSCNKIQSSPAGSLRGSSCCFGAFFFLSSLEALSCLVMAVFMPALMLPLLAALGPVVAPAALLVVAVVVALVRHVAPAAPFVLPLGQLCFCCLWWLLGASFGACSFPSFVRAASANPFFFAVFDDCFGAASASGLDACSDASPGGRVGA